MDSDTIKQAWIDVFPKSHVTNRSIMGSTCVALYLFPASELYNNIQDNDPLMYKVWIEGDNVRESDLYVLTRPPEGSNLVYKSVSMRRQTIKGADYTKLVRRFRKVRDWLRQQDMKHDISEKIG